jgi:Na+-translocating ferredoxin:NAD+ oxidoreductase RnfG subunit
VDRRLFLIPLAVVAPASAGHATVYMTAEQAQATMFPGETLTASFRTLTDAQVSAIRKAAGVSPLGRQLKAWRASGGGWLIIDEVVGKHEFIPFAVAIDPTGAVKSVEILEYRETYGGQVRDPRWRAQFTGKRAGAGPKLGVDIKNISGATLSSKHVTDGVRRLLDTYMIVLAHG